jgi:transcriptional regulator with XRE-family HTH domain
MIAMAVAVKRVRRAYGDSQERFAQRVHLSLMTVSKFERGVRVPKDPMVLSGLASAARAVNLTAEAQRFQDAAGTKTRSRAWMAVEDARALQSGIETLARCLPMLAVREPNDELFHDGMLKELISIAQKLGQIVGPAKEPS